MRLPLSHIPTTSRRFAARQRSDPLCFGQDEKTIPRHFFFMALGIDLTRHNGDTDERYATIIGTFSLVSLLVDRYCHTGLPLLWCLPSPTCHLTNTSLLGLISSSTGVFSVFIDLITAFTFASVIGISSLTGSS